VAAPDAEGDMTVLEREIAAIDGVVGAQIETIDGAPVSVRLDLEEGIDPAAVAGRVQDVLRRHGLKSRVPGGVEPEAAAPVPEPQVVGIAPEPDEEPAPAPAGDETVAAVPAPIASVTVRQSRGGVDVEVAAADGRTAAAAATAHPDEVAAAIVSAVAELAGVRRPRVVEVATQDVGGRTAVTLVADIGFEDLVVGTVFETGTTELAVARAAWAALVG
jgi:hypothetical protein